MDSGYEIAKQTEATNAKKGRKSNYGKKSVSHRPYDHCKMIISRYSFIGAQASQIFNSRFIFIFSCILIIFFKYLAISFFPVYFVCFVSVVIESLLRTRTGHAPHKHIRNGLNTFCTFVWQEYFRVL